MVGIWKKKEKKQKKRCRRQEVSFSSCKKEKIIKAVSGNVLLNDPPLTKTDVHGEIKFCVVQSHTVMDEGGGFPECFLSPSAHSN